MPDGVRPTRSLDRRRSPAVIKEHESLLRGVHMVLDAMLLGIWDGSALRSGLPLPRIDILAFSGEAIPLPARIVATADVFDALLSPRPYKPAWSFDATMAYMRVQRGRLFDPRCVDALQRGRERLRMLCERFSTAHPRPC